MAYVSTAPNTYFADDLAKFIDLPIAYRGQKIKIIPFSKNEVSSHTIKTDKELDDWMGSAVSEWWDDEAV
ncbi:MAG: hypothetical protein FWD24_07420 [Treponema sp.]|nr:hypothetical protein [Treponema sp.]